VNTGAVKPFIGRIILWVLIGADFLPKPYSPRTYMIFVLFMGTARDALKGGLRERRG
jgi:hypothetical protein